MPNKRFNLKSEPLTGDKISEPELTPEQKLDLERARKKVGPEKRAEKFLKRAGKKNKPADFKLEAEYPFDLPWSVV